MDTSLFTRNSNKRTTQPSLACDFGTRTLARLPRRMKARRSVKRNGNESFSQLDGMDASVNIWRNSRLRAGNERGQSPLQCVVDDSGCHPHFRHGLWSIDRSNFIALGRSTLDGRPLYSLPSRWSRSKLDEHSHFNCHWTRWMRLHQLCTALALWDIFLTGGFRVRLESRKLWPDKERTFLLSSKPNGAFKPHSPSTGPAAPFNNIFSLMRQEYACLQTATVIHFAARGINRC